MRKDKEAHKRWMADYQRRRRQNHVDLRTKLWLEQNKCCKLCERQITKPQLDHDHKTGKIRGVLCIKCNTTLGFFKDDPVFIQRFISYIQDQ